MMLDLFANRAVTADNTVDVTGIAMYPKCHKGLASLLALMLCAPSVFADVNYKQLAREQAERAAAAAAAKEAAAQQSVAPEPPPAFVPPTEPATTPVFPPETQTPVPPSNTTPMRSEADGPLEDQPLVIDISTLFDEDGLGTLSVQWQVQSSTGIWQSVDGAVSQSFTPRQIHVGQSLRVVIQYVDGQGTLEVIETAPTGPVQNVNDLPQGLPRISGALIEDSTLRIEIAGISDEDGLGQFQFQWERSVDGTTWEPVVSDAGNPALLRLNQARVGYAYRATLSYIDGFGTRETLVTAATDVVQNLDDPVEGQVILDGVARKGEQITVSTDNLRDEDGIANIRTTWEVSENGRVWTALSESAGTTLLLTQDHVNRLVRARAVVVDNFGAETTLFSQPTALVENVNSRPRGVIRILATGE